MFAAKTMTTVLLCSLVVSLLMSAEPDLRIAVNATTIESFPLFAAGDALSPNGKVQLVPVPNGRAAMSQLLSGAVDAATGSETQALLNSVADPRIRIILTLAECRYRIVARRSTGIRRTSDLRGRRVAVTANTSSHYYLDRMLRNARLTESDVQLMSLEGQEMPAALERRTVDAVAIWEPHAENARVVLGNDVVVLQDASAYIEQFNLNARTDVLANPTKRSALVMLVREIARASERLRKKPPALISSLSAKIDLSEKTVLAVWPQFSFPATISPRLRGALVDVEPWVAATQKRSPRASSELTALIDSTVQ